MIEPKIAKLLVSRTANDYSKVYSSLSGKASMEMFSGNKENAKKFSWYAERIYPWKQKAYRLKSKAENGCLTEGEYLELLEGYTFIPYEQMGLLT